MVLQDINFTPSKSNYSSFNLTIYHLYKALAKLVHTDSQTPLFLCDLDNRVLLITVKAEINKGVFEGMLVSFTEVLK